MESLPAMTTFCKFMGSAAWRSHLISAAPGRSSTGSRACGGHWFPRRALPPAPAIPPTLRRNCSFFLFFRLLFNLRFGSALARLFFALGAQSPPKMEPKPSQNRTENDPKFDVMLRTLKNESEQTIPHFSLFLLVQKFPKSSQNHTTIRFYLQSHSKTL